MVATDDFGKIYADGKLLFTTDIACRSYKFTLDSSSRILAIEVVNNPATLGIGYLGFILESSDEAILSNETWKCVSNAPKSLDWVRYDFNDTSWPMASCYAVNGDWYSTNVLTGETFSSLKACWIGRFATLFKSEARLFCRKTYKLHA